MTLRFARYRFDIALDSPSHLPFYAGSMLRGAFGHALRKIACITRQPLCKECALYHSCPYPRIFEPPPPAGHALQKFSQIPAPYVIEPPPPGALQGKPRSALVFHMVLIGPALAELPLIIAAWQRALRFGLGKADVRGVVKAVSLEPGEGTSITVYHDGDGEITEVAAGDELPGLAAVDVSTHKVRLNFQTPLRIQRQSKPLAASDMTARDLLIGLSRRLALLEDFYGQQPNRFDFEMLPAQAEAITLNNESLRWCDWQRYSHRQQQKMALGGVIGGLSLEGPLQPFLPALYRGQWCHLGKNATFGMGRYTLELIA